MKSPPRSQTLAANQFVSTVELAARWRCSRSTVRRIVDRAGIGTFYLGEGRNGMVRYSLKDVLEFELSRRV